MSQLATDTLVNMTGGMDPLAVAMLQSMAAAQNADTDYRSFLDRRLSQANAASAAADQAHQQMQQFADSPAMSPMQAVGGMFADIGAGIAKNPAISERFSQNMATQRAQRLAALRDEYLQKAEIARQMGQSEQALESEMMANKVQQAHQQMLSLQLKGIEQGGRLKELAMSGIQAKDLENLRHSHRLSEIGASGSEDRKLQGMKPNSAIGYDENNLLMPSYATTQIVRLKQAIKRKDNIRANVGEIRNIMEQRWSGEDPTATIARLMRYRDPVPKSPDRKDEVYALTGERVYKKPKGGQPLEKDPETAARHEAAVLELVDTLYGK